MLLIQLSYLFNYIIWFIITSIIRNMHNTKVQAKANNRLQSTMKKTSQKQKEKEKSKQKISKSKNKSNNLLSKVHQPSAHESVDSNLIKNFIKIYLQVAENKEKDLLTALLVSTDKQQKIKSISVQKKSKTTNQNQLPSMLQYLSNEQSNLLNALRIQMGKRKLRALDELELRRDIVALHGYIAGIPKNETLARREQGCDLLADISSKFDERGQVIGWLFSYLEKLQQFGQSDNDAQVKSKRFQEIIKSINEKVSNNLLQQHKQPSQQCEQQQKHIAQILCLKDEIKKLKSEITRLEKQGKKLEQQFECIVEEKLLLEERLKRNIEAISEIDESREQMKVEFANLREQVIEYRDEYRKGAAEIRKLMQQFGMDIFENFAQGYSLLSDSNGENQNIQVLQLHQAITTQQLNINRYLKLIEAMKKENSSLATEVQNLNSRINENEHLRSQLQQMCTACQLKDKKIEEQEIEIQELKNKIAKVVEDKQNVQAQFNNKIEQLCVSGEKEASQLRIKYEKEMEECVISCKGEMDKQKAKYWREIQEQRLKYDRKIEQQKIKYERELEQVQLQHCQKIEQQRTQCRKEIEQNKAENERKARELTLEYQREALLLSEKLKSQQEQYDNFKDITISECGMLLERKADEILLIKNLLMREKMIKEDILSQAAQKNNACASSYMIQAQKMAYNRNKLLKAEILKLKEEIEEFKLTIEQFSQILRNLFWQQCSKLIQRHSLTMLPSLIQAINAIKQKCIHASQSNDQSESVKQHEKKRLLKQKQNADVPLGNNCNQSGIDSQLIAVSPKQESKQLGEDQSSFLQQLDQYQSEQNSLQQAMRMSIQDITNESMLVEEVAAMREELAITIEKNHRLEWELKAYKQVEMDKIFDF